MPAVLGELETPVPSQREEVLIRLEQWYSMLDAPRGDQAIDCFPDRAADPS